MSRGTRGSSVQMHRFPRGDKERLEIWVEFVEKAGTSSQKLIKSSRICSLHLEDKKDGSKKVPTKFEPGKFQGHVNTSCSNH